MLGFLMVVVIDETMLFIKELNCQGEQGRSHVQGVCM